MNTRVCRMRSLILHPLFAGGGRRLISRSRNSGHGGRMLMSTMGASSSSSSSPWLMLPPGRDSSSGDIIHNFYSLAEQKHLRFSGGFALEDGTRFVGSSHGWLALFNSRTNHLFLTDPLSGRRVDLPPVDELPDPEINLRNGRATVSKVILSCSGDGDWHALMTFGPGNRLALCSARRRDCWTPIGRLFQIYDYPCKQFARNYEDFIYCRPGKSFICQPFDEKHEHCTEYWFVGDDYNRFPALTSIRRPDWSEEIPEESAPGPCFCIPHLVFVEQNRMKNQLLLVVRFVSDKNPFETFRFEVFRVENDHESVNKMRWLRPDRGDSLDGVAIFVGVNHSFAVAAADFPNIKPNSIYFTHSNWNFTLPDSVDGCDDIGIFDFEKQSVSPCSFYPFERITHPPLWFYPY